MSKYTTPVIKPEEDEFIVKSPFPDVEIPEINLSDYVWKDVEKYTDRLALVIYILLVQHNWEILSQVISHLMQKNGYEA